MSPINGVLKYHRLGNQERNDPNVPFERASVIVTDVSLAITEVLPFGLLHNIFSLQPIVTCIFLILGLFFEFLNQNTIKKENNKICY